MQITRRTIASVALVAGLVLAVPVLAACPDCVDDATCSPSEAKNFSSDEGCNFKTVGASCSMEHRRDIAVDTGAPVVCTAPPKEPMRWTIDTRHTRDDDWRKAKIPRPTPSGK
jgi:hypothetical protein